MQKKIPMRQCVGCREMKAKKELVRVVRSPEGDFGYVDESGRRYLEKGKYQILVKDKLFEVEL